MEGSPMFSPGQTVTLQTHAPERTLTLTIDRPFAPFTKAVVLLARCPELGPDPVVVKIYDPRFLDERPVEATTYRPARPWSLELERAADAIWDEPFDDFVVWTEEPEDPNDQAVRAVHWEKHLRKLSTGCFKDERASYEHLRPLQGTAIPRLLLTGTVLPPDERAFRPPAVVLEYIADAVSLGDVAPDLVTPELCASLLRVVDSFVGYGVVHADVGFDNVLFTPSARPTRVVVIDFGCGGAREEGQDDEAWEQTVRWAHDSSHTRWVLKQRGIGVPDV